MSNQSGPANYALIGVGIVMAVVMIVLDHNGLPPVSWVNEWQAARMGGKYYPKLTFVILFLIVAAPVGIIVAIVKAVRETSDGKKKQRRGGRRRGAAEPTPATARRGVTGEVVPTRATRRPL